MRDWISFAIAVNPILPSDLWTLVVLAIVMAALHDASRSRRCRTRERHRSLKLGKLLEWTASDRDLNQP
jgi:hypothetical protein